MKATIGSLSRWTLALLLLAGALSGCVTLSEARRAEAQAAQARYEAQAIQAQAMAQQAEAASRERIATVEAQERTERTTAWYNALPWLLAIVGGVACALLVLWFRGRAYLVTAQAQVAMMLPAPPQWPALPPPVQRAAQQYNAEVMADPTTPGAWLLVMADGRRVRMLPPAR